jgi:ABC-type nitrate/sulfonate/bicarbonate transport system substrate-binding protein
MRTTTRGSIRTSGAVALALTTALTLAACGGDSEAESSVVDDGTISVSVGLSAASVAVELGVEQGFFEEEGLELTFSSVENPSARVAAVQAGTVDVVELPATTLVKAVSQQVPVHALASENGYPSDADISPYDFIDVYVGPDSDVESMADLGDAKIGVPAREDLMEILLTNELDAAGADASGVEWIVLDFRSQVDALASGRVDAIAVPPPFNLLAEGNGARSVGRPAGTFFEQGPNSLWVVGDRLADVPEVTERLQRAIYRSNAYANEHSDEIITRAAENNGVDPSVLLDAGLAVYFPTTLDVADLERMAGKMAELGFLDEEVDIADAVVDPAEPEPAS